MKKLIYIDTETTGLDPDMHALTEVAAIVVIDGEEIERFVAEINPYTYTCEPTIDQVALNLTCKTEEMLRSYPEQKAQLDNFIQFMGRHIDLEDKKDQFQIVGYNTSFDIGFIKAWMGMNKIRFSSFFSYKDIDVLALVKHLRLWGMLDGCKDDKLGTVCELLEIPLDAHKAIDDIVATRELYRNLIDEYISETLYIVNDA